MDTILVHLDKMGLTCIQAGMIISSLVVSDASNALAFAYSNSLLTAYQLDAWYSTALSQRRVITSITPRLGYQSVT